MIYKIRQDRDYTSSERFKIQKRSFGRKILSGLTVVATIGTIFATTACDYSPKSRHHPGCPMLPPPFFVPVPFVPDGPPGPPHHPGPHRHPAPYPIYYYP